MKKVLCALCVVLVLCFCGQALADREEQYVREESARRNITLIAPERAESIALDRIGKDGVRVKDLELEEESDDYPNGTNFRPVYKIECVSGRDEYDVVIDAVTGEILKFKLDD